MFQFCFSVVAIICMWVPISGQSEQEPIPYIPTIEMRHPTFPPLALAARAEGEVRVEVTIDPTGYVAQAKMISGHPLLRKITETAVAQWRFVAEPENAIVRKTIITYSFQITDEKTEEDQEVTNGDTPSSFVIKNIIHIIVAPTRGCGGSNPEPARMDGVYWKNQKLQGGKKKK